jgi:copper transport protein
MIPTLMRRLAACFALVAVAAPGSAAAHANLVKTVPIDRAVLSKAPSRVLVVFDDPVRVGPGNEAVRNSGGSILGGKPRVQLKILELPLRAGLGRGNYSVRWSVISDDGHEEQGVLAFAVGSARPPESVLRPGSELRFGNSFTRWLFFSGLLLAGGLALFDLVVWRPLARRPLPTAWLAIGFATVFVSAVALVLESHAGVSTRFGLVMTVCAVIAVAGATAAAIGIVEATAALLAFVLALALLPVPTLAGHALDRGRWWANAPIDFLHVLGAAFWFGSLVALAVVVPTLHASREVTGAAVRRFSRLALLTVLVIAATGVGRAVAAFGSVSQIWTTDYGRAIVVKTVLFGLLLGLGWVSRSRIAVGYARLRQSVSMEVVVLLVVLGAVGVLTALPPGRAVLLAKGATSPAAALVRLPPPDATVVAQQDGKLAAALAVRASGAAMATFVGSDANAVDVGPVTIDGRPTVTCGVGCYAARVRSGQIASVAHGGRTLRFDLGLRRAAPRIVGRIDRAYQRLHSTVYRQRIVTGLGPKLDVLWTEVAPDSFSYRIAHGAEAVVIGKRRWDREPGRHWRASRTPITMGPKPVWGGGGRITNAHVIREGPRTTVVSFLGANRQYPAWFTVVMDRETMHLLSVKMTAAAHFMHVRYLSSNAPIKVEPPS